MGNSPLPRWMRRHHFQLLFFFFAQLKIQFAPYLSLATEGDQIYSLLALLNSSTFVHEIKLIGFKARAKLNIKQSWKYI